jgi:putative ABC transport system permease protein
MTDLLRDVRYALRTLWRARGFSLLAVAILGIGLGAGATMFSALDGVLLRPLPYADPDRLVVAWEANRAESDLRSGVSAAVFTALRDQEGAFSGVAAWRAWGFELGGTPEPERLRGARVSANLFTLLGVPALLGRPFAPGDDTPGAGPVVLLSEELWRRRFGADPAAVGTALELNGQPHVVVGVVPAGFVLPEADVWVTLVFAPYELDQRGNRALSVVARLGPGVGQAAARDVVRGVARRLQAEAPAAHAGWEVELEGLHRDVTGTARGPLLMLFAATCIVLLAACANLAGLLLARSVSRRRELALRAALGAGRWRIVRQLATEAMLLVAAAALLGLLLARAGAGTLLVLAGPWLPRGAAISIGPAVLGFVALIALVAGAALAAVPAIEAVRLDLHSALKATGVTARRRIGLRDATAAGQVALALLLLVGGGLLVRSFLLAQRVDPGFTARGVVAMTMSLPARYAAPEQRADFFATLESRVAALPGTRAAGLASHLPLSGGLLAGDFEVEGRPAADPGAATAHLVNVTPGYFGALGIPILAGRGFNAGDRLGAVPVVVIDAELARRYWPEGGAVGRRLRLGATLGADTALREVVGVAGSVRSVSLERAPEPTIYLPHAQNPWPSLSLVIGARRSPDDVVRAAVAQVHALDPSRPVYAVRSLDQAVSRLLAPRRLQTLLMGGFAGAVLGLAVMGVYGMLAHAVAQRTRELGVRMALGARREEILWLCLRRGLVRVGVGLGLGLAGALVGARLLTGLLFGLGPWDPITWAGAVVVVLGAGLAASALPALRAARLDPVAALRQE